jgi:hypothetical protein
MREVAPATTRSTRLASVIPRAVGLTAPNPLVTPTPTNSANSSVAAGPYAGRQIIERRNAVARRILADRVRDEFREMPGTSLTLPQAARLFGLRPDICGRLFGELIRDGKLTLATDSRYRLHPAA